MSSTSFDSPRNARGAAKKRTIKIKGDKKMCKKKRFVIQKLPKKFIKKTGYMANQPYFAAGSALLLAVQYCHHALEY